MSQLTPNTPPLGLSAVDALAALSALGQETRLAVFRLLVGAGPDGRAAGAISAALGVPPNTLSTHLSILARARLVQGERAGRTITYRADLDGMRALLGYLLTDCCGGRPDLCRPLLDLVALPAPGTQPCGCAPDPPKDHS